VRPKFLSLVFSGVLLAACQAAQPTGAEATATFCADLRALGRSVAALENTTGAATVGEYQQRVKAVEDSWNAVKESAKAVPQARVNDLENATEDLKKTVNGLSKDASLTEAAREVAPKAATVSQTRQQVGSGVRCATT
jgi:hypothetical protein